MAGDKIDERRPTQDQSGRIALAQEAMAHPQAHVASTSTQAPIVDKPKALPGEKTPTIPSSSTADIFRQVRDSTVLISHGAPGSPKPDATGFFVKGKNGEIEVATNWHVAAPATFRDGAPDPAPGKFLPTELEVTTASGEKYPVTIDDFDPRTDLALLKFGAKKPPDAKPLPLAAEAPKPGDPLWVVGHPHADPKLHIAPGTMTSTTSEGEVDRQLVANAMTPPKPGMDKCSLDALQQYPTEGTAEEQAKRAAHANAIALEARMRTAPGNSGSPELNAKGEVVGIDFLYKDDTDRTYTIGAKHLSDLIQHTPEYSFHYEPDPKRPGYQVLTSASGPGGSELPFVMSLTGEILDRCQEPGQNNASKK